MFNYVMVLASVIVGLGVTHLLQGIVSIVQHPGRERVYWIHLTWVGAAIGKSRVGDQTGSAFHSGVPFQVSFHLALGLTSCTTIS